MNDKVDQKLNDIMGIESTIKKETAEVIKKVPARTDNVETDYRYARENRSDLKGSKQIHNQFLLPHSETFMI